MIRRILSFSLVLGALAAVSTARATVAHYQAALDGPSESPANASPATGFTFVDYDNVAHTLTVQSTFSGLTGTSTASHIHAATTLPFTSTAGVATQTPSFSTFPLGVTSGAMPATSYDLTLASSWNGAFITANGGTPATAEVALASAMSTGRAYLNIHSSTFGGGEIRGFLIPVVPEPSTLALASLGLVALRRRRK